jgi:eukaryotic-like serine/threonine-protein kinase
MILARLAVRGHRRPTPSLARYRPRPHLGCMSDIPSRLNAALEGRYVVERELGQGGMATVYLAKDLKHNRPVALKVLKPELAAVVGAERFLSEIETTANLQHPHILALFDSGEADSFLFYVMPYLDGETLQSRIQREGQLPVQEAVQIATDVAEALDHAHRHGVIHRDIKPANILLQDGRPVVADFGIALAVSSAGGGRLTETGLSLGTPYYMSPEQATGDRDVDARSDVYSLACVVYEMLTGEPPYTGSTAQAVLGRILMSDVERPSVQRKSIPNNVEAALLCALERLPADRFGSGADFARALKDPSFSRASDATAAAATSDPPASRSLWQTVLPLGVVALLAGALGWTLASRGTPPVSPQQHEIRLGSGFEKVPEFVAFGAALHPEGRGVLFADSVDGQSGRQTWWKGRDELEPTPLPWLDGVRSPTFSPEGDWVLSVKDGELRKVPLTGGNSVLLASGVSGGTAHALVWLDDGTVIFENAGFRMERVSADGQGEAVLVSEEAQTGQPIHAAGLPGSWGVLVSACVNSCPSGNRLSLIDLEADTVVTLADDVVRAWPAPDHHIVYLTRAGDVFTAPLDRASRSLGSPLPLFRGIRVSADSNGDMHVAPNGSALFVMGSVTVQANSLLGVEREDGRGTGRATLREAFSWPTFSPEGDRLAISMRRSGVRQIWVREGSAGSFLPVSPFETAGFAPQWHADGVHISYISSEGGNHLRTVRADGTSSGPDSLISGLGSAVDFVLTRNADTVVFVAGASGGSGDSNILLAEVGSGQPPSPLVATPAYENDPALSPDGRWLAYASDLSGVYEVYVQPFPDGASTRTPLSSGGGRAPVWSRDGQEIFYLDDQGWLVAASYSTDPTFRIEGRERLFDASGYVPGFYDVYPGAQEFLFLAPSGSLSSEEDALVLYEGLFDSERSR